MKTKTIITSMVASFISVSAFGGGGSGGGIPPALESLEAILSTDQSSRGAGLFIDESGKLGLGVKGTLESSLVVTKSAMGSQSTRLHLSNSDFDSLQSRSVKHIDAIGLQPKSSDGADASVQRRSYLIHDGDAVEELNLTDRREAIRSEVAR